MTNTGLSVVFCLMTFSRAFNLGICLALSIAAWITFELYSLDNNISFNSLNLFSLASVSEQILTILSASENGIFEHTLAGWQLDVSKYWFLSLSFLNKSVRILPVSLILQEESRKGIEVAIGQSQEESLEFVWLRVNFMLG